MKLNDVVCPRKVIPEFVDKFFQGGRTYDSQAQCGSYEITFGTPLYKDREYDEVVIEAVCDSCGHEFQVFGHVVITKVDMT